MENFNQFRIVEIGESSIDLLIAYAPKVSFAPFNELKEVLISNYEYN